MLDVTRDTLTLIELHTLTLINGDIIRLCNSHTAVEFGGGIYQPAVIERGSIEESIDVEVATVTLTIGSSVSHRGRNAVQMFADGLFSSASYRLDLYEPNQNDSRCLFRGHVADETTAGSYTVTLKIKSILYQLENFALPRIVYQSQCNNSLFDFGCGLSSSDYRVQGVVDGGDRKTVYSSAFYTTDGWFKYGKLAVTGGENAGQSRYILSHSGGGITVDKPFWFDFAVGDTFDVFPGCDKLGTTCRDKFNNYAHFAGFEFVPQEDTVLKI